MEVINASIKGVLEIGNIDYFVIIDQNKNKYSVPKSQIDTFAGIELHREYNFIKNKRKGKINLSLLNPNYKINEITSFKVNYIKNKGNEKYFILESNFYDSLTVKILPGQENMKKIECKIRNYYNSRPIIENIDTSIYNWDYNKIYKLKIVNFLETEGNKKLNFINVNFNENEIRVKAKPWQAEKYWNFPDIYCKTIGITSQGLPKLITYDHRHIYLKINKVYQFKVNKFKIKENQNKHRIEVIELYDYLGLHYEVSAIPNQRSKLKKDDKIDCLVKDINNKVFLSQDNPDDPFFYYFEDIIKEKDLKRKFFDSVIKNKIDFPNLISQYDEKRAFWVFTYCNRVILRLKDNATKRKNLDELLQIIDLHSRIEKWILKEGILRAIKDDIDRKKNKLKAESIISSNNKEKEIVKRILNYENTSEIFNDKVNFIYLFYYIKHANFFSIDIVYIIKLLNKQTFDRDEIYFCKKILNLVNNLTNINFDDLTSEYFVFTSKLNEKTINDLTNYLNWIHFNSIICSILKFDQQRNFYIAKHLRISAMLESQINQKKKLLRYSFEILKNPSSFNYSPIYISKTGDVEICFEKLEKSKSIEHGKDLTSKNKFVEVIERYYYGFKVKFENIIGFIPIQNIKDKTLKESKILNLKWKIYVEITVYSKELNYFLCKQVDNTNNDFHTQNIARNKKLVKGDIVYGSIKNITRFESGWLGAFITTDYGVGLVHEKNISEDHIIAFKNEYTDLIGKQIPLYFLSYKESKLNFSLKELSESKYEEQITQTIYNTDNDSLVNNIIDIDLNVELEKGYLFEQYATLENRINSKKNYVKLAKASFSNTNNARSFLLNVYLDYFDSLDYLDDVIKNYTFNNYDKFREFILNIKLKLDEKTLIEFPESKNLIFFINILYLFNSDKEKDLQTLFKKIEDTQDNNEITLKAVAKIVLANNLLLTELDSSQISDREKFTLKNLNRIRKFIDNGVLSTEETKEDILYKEKLQKLEFWKSKINEDEGENLEFKATFKTPVPDKAKKKILSSLEKQIKKTSDTEKKEKINKKIKEIKLSENIEKQLIYSALKNICAFSNTNGGHLILGVSDDKKIYGLEQDYNSFKKDNEKNRDGFGKFLDSKINEYFGESFSSSYTEKEFIKFDEGDILVIKVLKSPKVVHILKNEHGKKEENVYVRNLSSSNKLKGIELYKFIENKLENQ